MQPIDKPYAWTRIASLGLALVGVDVAFACKTGENKAHTQATASNDAALWTDPKAIPVCWMQAKGFEADQSLIKARVAAEYAQAGFAFVGWAPCVDADFKKPVIRVEFRDALEGDKPGSYTVGCSLVGAAYGALNCDEKRSGSNMWIVKSDNPYHFDAVHSGLHEFGHALGLLHEHLRDDRTPLIDPNDPSHSRFFNDQLELFHGDTKPNFLTVYDAESIMNYCSKQKGLTELDIEGLIKLYHLPQSNKPISPLTTAESCTGVDHQTIYPDGQVTTYAGNIFTCKKGSWINTQVNPETRPISPASAWINTPSTTNLRSPPTTATFIPATTAPRCPATRRSRPRLQVIATASASTGSPSTKTARRPATRARSGRATAASGATRS